MYQNQHHAAGSSIKNVACELGDTLHAKL